MSFALFALLLVLSGVLFSVWKSLRIARREQFIRNYSLPMGLFDRLRKIRPELSLKDCQLVSHALRQFFLAHLKSGRKFVSMPSQVTDDLWHEFILYTRNYEQFCQQAFGQFLHHTPAVVLSSSVQSNSGLRRCWWYVCKEENINPRAPTRLPLLFALDAKLKIADGFTYAADCSGLRKQQGSKEGSVIYCGGDFSGSSSASGDSNFAFEHDASYDSASDAGGGDGGGGSGCGGGCGGGGD